MSAMSARVRSRVWSVSSPPGRQRMLIRMRACVRSNGSISRSARERSGRGSAPFSNGPSQRACSRGRQLLETSKPRDLHCGSATSGISAVADTSPYGASVPTTAGSCSTCSSRDDRSESTRSITRSPPAMRGFDCTARASAPEPPGAISAERASRRTRERDATAVYVDSLRAIRVFLGPVRFMGRAGRSSSTTPSARIPGGLSLTASNDGRVSRNP